MGVKGRSGRLDNGWLVELVYKGINYCERGM